MYTLILEANSLPICYTDVNNEWQTISDLTFSKSTDNKKYYLIYMNKG